MVDIPIYYIVPIGNDEPIKHLVLHAIDVPSAVMEKDSIVIDAFVAAPDCKHGSSAAVLRLGDREMLA